MIKDFTMGYDSVYRKLLLLTLLPNHPKTKSAKQLVVSFAAKGYQTNQRLLQKDLNYLLDVHELGLIVDNATKPFQWAISADWKRVELSKMDNDVALALSILDRVGNQFLPNSSLQELKELFAKANSVVTQNEDSVRWLDKTPNTAAVKPFDDDILILEQAIKSGKQVSGDIKRFIKGKAVSLYYSSLSPYGIVNHDGEKYLVFRVGSDQKLNQWPIQYLSNISQLNSMSKKIALNNLSQQGRRYRGETILFECLAQPQSKFVSKLQTLQYPFDTVMTENGSVKVSAKVVNSAFFRELIWSHVTSIKVLSPMSIKHYIHRQTERLNSLI
jgi:predicted DNA-binding transcriptional regulator YafY